LCDLFDDESALLKHEVAFVLGQMARGEAIDTLVRVLKDKNENIMVAWILLLRFFFVSFSNRTME